MEKCPIQHVNESVTELRIGSRSPTGFLSSSVHARPYAPPRQLAISLPRKRSLLSALLYINKLPDFTAKGTSVGSCYLQPEDHTPAPIF